MRKRALGLQFNGNVRFIPLVQLKKGRLADGFLRHGGIVRQDANSERTISAGQTESRLECSKMISGSNASIALWRNALAYFLVSVVLVVPCLWHAYIEAGDLGSHVDNAWLAQLVQQGRAPGVYVVWQAQWVDMITARQYTLRPQKIRRLVSDAAISRRNLTERRLDTCPIRNNIRNCRGPLK